ncbi:MAG: DUF1003 domain-containing protein, partial [Schaalia odontolytica]
MADRLDNPIDKRRWFFRRSSGSGDGFGRFAEATARFMGSPKFVLYMTIFVVAWISANLMLAGISEEAAWDPYPFILLNLAFSTQASYSAPLIMLAQNRQDARDRVVAEQDLDGDGGAVDRDQVGGHHVEVGDGAADLGVD